MVFSDMEGFVIWFTGLPGSGKTTVARKVESLLLGGGLKVEVLDGDELRVWLSPEAGFSREGRERHLKRVTYISQLLSRNGVIVLVPVVSPYLSVRDFARSNIKNFVEVYVKCSLETCIKRDPKGFYKRAQMGQIKDMTGLQDPYEEPLSPELVLDTDKENEEESTQRLLDKIIELGFLPKDLQISSKKSPIDKNGSVH